MERTENQRCALTFGELRAEGVLPRSDCPYCEDLGKLCKVSLHGVTTAEVATNRLVWKPNPGAAAEDLREGLEALKASTEALKKRVSTGLDERLFYFSRLMPSSSGKHTAAATTIWDKYDECVVCGRKREFDASGRATVTLAHIVPGNSLISYKAFGRPRYRDDLNIKSIRNFLPLCGTEGLAESCHNEFDKYLLTILYDPFLKVFKALSLNALWSKHDACNGKTLRLSHTPYRRLLAWRTRHCFQVNSFLLNGISDIDALISAANFSEESHSIAGDDAAGTIDTSSAITKVSGSV